MNNVEKLKAQSEWREAGREAHRHGAPRYYGCHYGLRSTREVAIQAFFDGYDEEAAYVREWTAKLRAGGPIYDRD